ncbi:MAG: tetraacyldisaccharide 4'-kinase [Nitrospirales bacterium]
MSSLVDIGRVERSLSWFQHYCPALLLLPSIPYGLVVRIRSQLYEHGWLKTQRLPRPVVSVGNLTVGGTGKTPIVMWLANQLRAKGKRIGILSRGYRRTMTADYVLVSNGEKVLTSPLEVGDEPFLMAQNCPGTVIAVGKDRYKLGLWLLEQMDVDYFILDDGYQHLQLYRDCNLLLIDALDQQGIQAVLPAGRLREPLSAAQRATAIMVTRVDQALHDPHALYAVEVAIGQKVSSIDVQFQVKTVINIRTQEIQSRAWMVGKRAIIFSGIGNALAFRRTAEQMGVEIVEEIDFPDHFQYDISHLHTLRVKVKEAKAEMLLTTEKDGVKITPFLEAHDEIWVLQLEPQIVDGEEQFLQALECLTQ